MRSFGNLTRILGVLLFAGTLWALATAQSVETPEPSLGDVARQKPEKKAKRVITDDDMPRHEPDATEPAAGSRDEGKNAPEAAKDDKAENPETAARPDDPEQKLKDARNEVEVMRHTEAMQQELYNKLRDRLKDETDSFRKEVLEEEIKSADQNMTTMHEHREKAEKEVAELQAAIAEKHKKSTPPPAENPAHEQQSAEQQSSEQQ